MKTLLHASRHSCTSVNGLLLGRLIGQAEVEINDAVPLFHSPTVLGPCFETALVQVLQLAQSTSQEVVGYYEADPQVGEPELSSMGRKIGERFIECGLKCSIFVLDNLKFGEFIRSDCELPFIIYGKSGDRWKRTIPAGEAALVCDSNSLSVKLNTYLADKKHYRLVDFDDHLDDISRDWRNIDIFR